MIDQHYTSLFNQVFCLLPTKLNHTGVLLTPFCSLSSFSPKAMLFAWTSSHPLHNQLLFSPLNSQLKYHSRHRPLLKTNHSQLQSIHRLLPGSYWFVILFVYMQIISSLFSLPLQSKTQLTHIAGMMGL